MSASKKARIGAAALLVVAVLAASLVLGLGGCGKVNDNPTPGNGGSKDYEIIIEEYFKAIEQADGEKLFSLSHDSLARGAYDENSVAWAQKTFLDEYFRPMMSFIGTNIKATYAILDVGWEAPSMQWEIDAGINEYVYVEINATIRGTENARTAEGCMLFARVDGRLYFDQNPLTFFN